MDDKLIIENQNTTRDSLKSDKITSLTISDLISEINLMIDALSSAFSDKKKENSKLSLIEKELEKIKDYLKW